MPNPLYRKSDWARELTASNPEKYRSESRRDYARLIHSPAFRRLQGKTQLFRGLESDFFRNRLTHSLEVAQIAKSIAIKINSKKNSYFKDNPIDTELVEIAGLAHDLGHPPFGHTGEEALDKCMKNFGGFEGNAQTLRILARLEKKQLSDMSHLPVGITPEGEDKRLGLNLCYRTLASILKYDKQIPSNRDGSASVAKGYYRSESHLVENIKRNVLMERTTSKRFKTLECSIMDISDDIAYSVYDLEDCFKAGFMTPLDLVASDGDILHEVARRVLKHMRDAELPGQIKEFSDADVIRVLSLIFQEQFEIKTTMPELSAKANSRMQPEAWAAINYLRTSKRSTENGYLRTRLTSNLIAEFIQGVDVKIDKAEPALSKAYLKKETLEKVEVLKNFTFVKMILSPMLKVVERRGADIVKTIFDVLTSDNGYRLLPQDFQYAYCNVGEEAEKKRVVCDFIAGMTDRYVVEFYGRLTSESAQSIFKPI